MVRGIMAKKKTTKKVTKKTTKKVAAKKVTKKATKKALPKKAKKESAEVIVSGVPQVGDMAPEFTLPDQDGRPVSLRDFRGQNVVVYFYPRAMTPGCTVQACSLRDSADDLKRLNVVVLGISADSPARLRKFQERDKLNFTLLSDENHSVTGAYGSWGKKKFMGREFMGILRQSFFVGPDGKIVHVMRQVNTASHNQDVINFFSGQK